MKSTIIFFGSFLKYSTIVLEKLKENFDIAAIVTTPPKPAGRHLKIRPTHVALCAKNLGLEVYELLDLQAIPKEIKKPDFLVVAGYGKLIPQIWLDFPKIMAVNFHPSLLPNYRGAFPAEWAILRGEKESGVSLVRMTAEFDKGPILAQQPIAIADDDTRETLYKKLYELGATLLLEVLPKIAEGSIIPHPQLTTDNLQPFYARRLTREDGFVPWELLQQAVLGADVSQEIRPKLFSSVIGHWSSVIERALRALSPWPGVWTTLTNGQRLKLLSLHPEPLVQLEGKKAVNFKEFKNAHLN